MLCQRYGEEEVKGEVLRHTSSRSASDMTMFVEVVVWRGILGEISRCRFGGVFCRSAQRVGNGLRRALSSTVTGDC